MKWIIIVIEQGENEKHLVHRYDTVAHARAFIRSAAKSGSAVLGPYRVTKTPAEDVAELALQACRSLDYAYFRGKLKGGSIDWADLDEAHVEAVKAVRVANRAAKKGTL
jgi:hypothetical protein